MMLRFTAVLLALTLVLSVAAVATAQESDQSGQPQSEEQQREQPAWAFAEHSFENEELKVEINGFLQNGYIPVGMDVTPNGTLSLVYALNTWFEYENWAIQEFTNLDNLNAEVTTVLQEGWVPMAMSATDDGLQMFLLKTDIDIDAWQIAVGPLSVDSAVSTLESWRNDGYTPWAITLTPDDEVWYLFLEQSHVPEDAVLFNGFENTDEAITEGINEDLKERWYPWGMMRGEESTFFQYLR